MDGVEYESDREKQEVNVKDSEKQVNSFRQNKISQMTFCFIYIMCTSIIFLNSTSLLCDN